MYKGERFNSISHLVGAVAGLIGLVLLVVSSTNDGDKWKIFSFSVYGATLLFLYVISTLYHSARGRAKQILRMLDYHAIYLLIAGTYTPFALVSLRGPWGWTIFTIIWVLAAIGIWLDSPPRQGPRILPVVLYLVMGWLILIALGPLLRELTVAGFSLLLAGGLSYSFGVIFFVKDQKVRHFHGIWHLFVLAGSVIHYFTVFYYVQ
jgi:hemolysin III